MLLTRSLWDCELPIVHVRLLGYKPFRLFNNFHRVSCLWDLPWIVADIFSILFIETEATAMKFMDCNSSSELRPNGGIGSELGGRPEIFQMENNPQEPDLPLNPHEAPTTSNAPQSMPHREQEAELAHPAPQEWQPALSLPSQSKNPGGETQFQEFLNNLSPLQQEDPFSSFSPITGKDEAPISFPEQAERRRRRLHLILIRLTSKRGIQNWIERLRRGSKRPSKAVFDHTAIVPALPNAFRTFISKILTLRLWQSS